MIAKVYLIENKIYKLGFLLLSFALSISLFVEGYPAKIFYLCCYASILFILIRLFDKKMPLIKNALLLTFAVLFFGLIRIVWAAKFKDTGFPDVVENYHTGGKRLILFAPLFYYLYSEREFLSEKTKLYSLVTLLLGVATAFLLAINEYLASGQRIKLLTDSAGTVTYLFFFIMLTALYLFRQVVIKPKIFIVGFSFIFIISMGFIALTESRAAMIFVPFIYFSLFILMTKGLNKKLIHPLGFISIIMVPLFLMPSKLYDRIESIEKEISNYQHNHNDTSIGGRFSIWKSGFSSVSWTLLGQSPDERNLKARKYINQLEKGNAVAYRNVVYHLHDDLLETLSLQGVLGFLSLTLVLMTMLLFPVIAGQPVYAILPLSLIVFGLTDTVLIQSQTIVIFLISLTLSFALLKRN